MRKIMKSFTPKFTTNKKPVKPEGQSSQSQNGLSEETPAFEVSQIIDNRPETKMQQRLQAMSQMSPQAHHLDKMQATDDFSPRKIAQRQQIQRCFGRPVQRQAEPVGRQVQMNGESSASGRQVIQRELDERWKPEVLQSEEESKLNDETRNLRSILELYFGLDPEDKSSKYGFSLLQAARQSAKGELLNDIRAEIETLTRQMPEVASREFPDARKGEPLGKGAIQQTYLVTVGGVNKVWKPEPASVKEAFSAFSVGGIPSKGARISLRGEAASKIAESLGAAVLTKTELHFGYDIDGNLVTGQLMDFVKGEPLGEKGTVSPETKSTVKTRPDFVKDLFTLQLIDYITGQVDRHTADVFMGEAGIKAVDHDFSLGKAVAGQLRKEAETEEAFYKKIEPMAKILPDYRHIKYIPQYIDISIAKMLRAYDVDSLDELLGKHLTKSELAAVRARITHAQKQLSIYMKVVPKWEDHFRDIERPETPKSEEKESEKKTKKKKTSKFKELFRRKGRSPGKQELESTPLSPPAKEFVGSVPYIQPKINPVAQYIGKSYRAENCMQRVQKNLKLNRTAPWLSHGDKGPMEEGGEGVITATSGDSPTGTHTRIFMEKVEEPDSPSTIHTDLQNPDGIRVTIEEIQNNKEMLDKLENLPRRRTWRVDQSRIADAKAEAERIKDEAAESKYKYVYLGRSRSKEREAINCAKYGEKVLEAAGISASAGRVFKIPRVLTRPPKAK
jgi:hypothetical protein